MNIASSLLAASLTLVATAAQAEFTLSSPSAPEGTFQSENILSEPYGFGCSGSNMSLALDWSDAPEGTQSYVLRMHDPDAPTGIGGWTHWVVVNIPAHVTHIDAGGPLPSGALETRTDFGVAGYGGPCPPENSSHKYVVTLDAMPMATLPEAMISADSMPALIGFITEGASLGQASLTLTYGR
nr:YbhB/YbcL family Raf kinase inhibitor-like protein [uncultured Cohaesibacter sp.]